MINSLFQFPPLFSFDLSTSAVQSDSRVIRNMAPSLALRPFYSLASSSSWADEFDKPYVSISELDSGTNAVVSSSNYSYVSSVPNALTPITYPSDYYPYYKRDYNIWNTDPLTYSSLLLASPMYNWRRSVSHYPWTGNYLYRRRYYPSYTDMSYYLARLIPYYTHPRPVYTNVYSPHYHYNYEGPRTSVVTRTRTYTVPTIANTVATRYYSSYSYM